MTKTKSTYLALLAVLLSPMAANADPITVDFSVSPPTGVGSSGYFTFDDSIIPAGGGGLSLVDLITDLSFEWGGIAYDETTANTGFFSFAFDASEVLTGFIIGNNCFPGGCSVSGSATGWLIGTGNSSFAYSNGDGLLFGSLDDWSIRAAVPEPSTLALLGIGLLGMGAARRRKKA